MDSAIFSFPNTKQKQITIQTKVIFHEDIAHLLSPFASLSRPTVQLTYRLAT